MTWPEVAAERLNHRMRRSEGCGMSDKWFSDEALRKQAALKTMQERGEESALSALCGFLEPRTQPQEYERCVHCRSDARDKAGGGESKGARWCGLCLVRGRDDDYEGTS